MGSFEQLHACIKTFLYNVHVHVHVWLTFLYWWEHGHCRGDRRCGMLLICLTTLGSWTMDRTGHLGRRVTTVLTDGGGRGGEIERKGSLNVVS
jgi:hypothetical protein